MRTKVKNDSHLTPFHQKEIISTIFECINNKFQIQPRDSQNITLQGILQRLIWNLSFQSNQVSSILSQFFSYFIFGLLFLSVLFLPWKIFIFRHRNRAKYMDRDKDSQTKETKLWLILHTLYLSWWSYSYIRDILNQYGSKVNQSQSRSVLLEDKLLKLDVSDRLNSISTHSKNNFTTHRSGIC